MSDSPNPFEPPRAPTTQPTATDLAAGRFAACPRCGQSAAQRVRYTLWGGVLGPKLFTHVKCQTCGNKYNGKTGRSNTPIIVSYSVGSLVIGAALGFLVMRMMSQSL